MSRSRKAGGSGGTANKAIWFVVMAGLIFSFFGIPYDPGAKGIQEIVVSKSETVKGWVEGIAPGVSEFIGRIIQGGSENPGLNPGTNPNPGGNTGGGTTTSPAGTEEATTALNALKVGNPDKSAYDRDDWKHWSKQGASCWDTRDQVLYNQAQPGTIKMVDADNKATTDIKKACKVTGGSWLDPYTGKTFTNPGDLDIDHMIPLKKANSQGGAKWDANRKEAYANSLNGNDLLAVSASANRSKSDRGPAEWKPENKAHHCNYAKDWVATATTWQLTVSESDKKALTEMLATCG